MKSEDLIAITGASSFVGARLCMYLAKRGRRVAGGISKPLETYHGLRAERLRQVVEAGCELFVCDMESPDDLQHEITRLRPEYWISHAGWTKDYASDQYDLAQAHRVNVEPYGQVVELLREVGAKGLISTSSSAVYGDGDGGALSEGTLCHPRTPYGLSKYTKTLYLGLLAERYGLPVRIARVFLPFGNLDSPGRFAASAFSCLQRGEPFEMSDGSLRRDFLHVDDLCAGYEALLKDLSRECKFEIFNFCSGEATRLRDFAEGLACRLGASPGLITESKLERKRREAPSQYGSFEKARRILGWTPRPLEQAIDDYVAEVMEQGPARPPVPSLVRLSRSSIDAATIRGVSTVLALGFLGMGQEVARLEEDLKRYIGGTCRQVVCVNTGTSALHLAVQGCGIGPGDEVLVPTITYVASYQAISATGAIPVSCDVRYGDCLLDLSDAERRITPRTRAVMPVHYASNPALLGEVYRFAERHGLRVIEDAAQCFGCSWRGQKVGASGDVVCFSFDGVKNITCGEGGAVVTSDPVVAENIRNARLLGVVNDTENRFKGGRSWTFDVAKQGWRYHMSNLNAALGRAQLKRLDGVFAPVRVAMARRYQELLADISGLRMLDVAFGDIVPYMFVICVDPSRRDDLRANLRAANIETGIHYQPNHLLTLYGGGRDSLPVAERLHHELMTLPLHAELTCEEQDRVVTVVKRKLGVA